MTHPIFQWIFNIISRLIVSVVGRFKGGMVEYFKSVGFNDVDSNTVDSEVVVLYFVGWYVLDSDGAAKLLKVTLIDCSNSSKNNFYYCKIFCMRNLFHLIYRTIVL